MKKLIVLSLFSVLLACSDNEKSDPMEGPWQYQTTDVSGTKPLIKASFIVKAKGDTYTLNNLLVTVNTTESTDFSYSLEAVQKGDRIGKIIFTKGADIITMYKFDNLVAHPGGTVDSVIYMQGSTKIKYIGGLMSK